jgi:hypothetical protein
MCTLVPVRGGGGEYAADARCVPVTQESVCVLLYLSEAEAESMPRTHEEATTANWMLE